MSAVRATPRSPAAEPVGALPWPEIEAALNAQGWAMLPGLLNRAACASLIGVYDTDSRFRSRIAMARHGFGRGEYKYFAYPLPPPVASLRTALYAELAPIANRWHAALGESARFPADHRGFLARCRDAGQVLPTPLLLRYRPGDYNCLHRDVYGTQTFPLQVAVLLSQPDEDFTGGEFVLTEQRPRMQSRAAVVPLRRGDAVVFAVHSRPTQGTRGTYRVQMRHSVSALRTGDRYTLGIIFHDAP